MGHACMHDEQRPQWQCSGDGCGLSRWWCSSHAAWNQVHGSSCTSERPDTWSSGALHVHSAQCWFGWDVRWRVLVFRQEVG
jgi:hypothetical protein